MEKRKLKALLTILALFAIMLDAIACSKRAQEQPEQPICESSAVATTGAGTNAETGAEQSMEAETKDETEEMGTEVETTEEEASDAKTDLFAYTDDEMRELSLIMERQNGLVVTYYSDQACTAAVSSAIVEKPITVPAGNGVLGVRYEGFIRFDADGKHELSLPGKPESGTITLCYGEHHPTTGKTLTVDVKAGTWYNLTVQLTRKSDSAVLETALLCDGKTTGYALNIGRPLLGGEAVGVTPVMDIPMRDCQVCTGPDGCYYMTGTSGPDFWDYSNDIHVYKSDDLIEWTDLGAVWKFADDATWAKKVSKDTRVPVWAPEIQFINGCWYIVYSMGFNDGYCGGILKSTTGLVTGPYTDTTDAPLVDNIDLSLFADDDGTAYMLYKDGLIARLNRDMTGFEGEFVPLLTADGLPVGFEGTSIFKANGLYYLTGATYNRSINSEGKVVITYDSMVAVSKNLYGPYSTARLLLRNGGHNNLFADTEGNIWTTLFAPTGNLGFFCKPAIVRLVTNDNSVLSPALYEGETVKVGEDGLFRLSYDGRCDSLLVSMKTARTTAVYINGKYAFTAKASNVYINYKISKEALETLVSGVNQMSFENERKANISAFVKTVVLQAST